jgi:type IV secretion system protein VirD4
VPGIGGGRNRSPSINISDQKRALMLPQEIKEMPSDREIVFVENLLPIKCHKIKYFEDKRFMERLLPPPSVKAHDVSQYLGARTDDHFARWQQRTAPMATRLSPLAAMAPMTLTAAPGSGTAERDFSLDFSAVRVPEGRYLSTAELDVAVNSFLDELETA